MSDEPDPGTDTLWGITYSTIEGGFVPYAVRRYGGRWQVGPHRPEVDPAARSDHRGLGGGLHHSQAAAWAGWRKFIQRLADSASQTHARHMATLAEYEGK